MLVIFALVFFSIIVGAAAIVAINIYNALVILRKQIDRSWANIDVILKQRHDEVPQLIEIIEQYTLHEKAIIEKVTEARSRYLASPNMSDKITASNELTQAIKGVLAIGEAYPELKSNTQFLQLQTRLSALEEQLADRREHFNDTVTNFNTRISQFPDMFFAQTLGYREMELFKVADDEKSRPLLKVRTAA